MSNQLHLLEQSGIQYLCGLLVTYKLRSVLIHINSQRACFFGFAVGQVSTALQLHPEEFKEKYGAEMPQQTENVVFTCLAGIRSKTALDTATSLGYKE